MLRRGFDCVDQLIINMSDEGLRLNCLAFGDENTAQHIFTVDISRVKNVSTLKELIKAKKQPTLDHLAADQLVL
jgi:hypothetical protein